MSSYVDVSHLHQSYPDILHGGVISFLFDGLMTNCLFSSNIFAMTARLEVRYLQPVEIKHGIHLKAQLSKSKSALHFVKAELLQKGIVKAMATGSFIERPRQ